MVAKKVTDAVAKQSFIKKDILTDKFRYASTRMQNLEKISLTVKVNSEEELTVAENNASDSQALLKEVDAMRKIIKAPYFDTVKLVDSYCKGITDTIERIKLRFSAEITKYKVLKEAQLKAASTEKIEVIRTIEQEKKEEAEKLFRIETQLLARIYGGTYTKRDGTPQSIPGCIKPMECEILDSWIQINVPAITTFKHFATDYEDMLIDVGTKLTQHKLDLLDLLKEDYPSAKEGAMRRINEARVQSLVDLTNHKERVDRKIEKEIKSEVKSVNSEIDDAGKGVRSRLAWEERDLTLVPIDFLSVDSVKVNAYINDNKERIYKDVSEGKDTIPGLKIYVDTKFVAR